MKPQKLLIQLTSKVVSLKEALDVAAQNVIQGPIEVHLYVYMILHSKHHCNRLQRHLSSFTRYLVKRMHGRAFIMHVIHLIID
jgi:hypothetical protein